jgi:selenocysteine lyase/cysteine desulfurase
MNINSLRADTPGVEHVIHFNNAGAALPVQSQLDIITEYLNKEAIVGGYRHQAQNAERMAQFYKRAAQLIGAKPEEIAITGNASDGFNHILYSIPFEPGDVILTTGIEYGNNFVNYINLKNKYGVEIQVVPNLPTGAIDLKAFERMINSKVRLIAVTHIPTSSGIITPVADIGEIANRHNILYLVDACQSIGHVPFDVEKIGCHFASVTSRKYLRGPRGLGFLYVKENTWDLLQPKHFDTTSAHWRLDETVKLDRSARMFEHWEKSYALIMGFSEALRYLLALGSEATWARIQEVASYARDRLAELEGVSLCDPGTQHSGIITFNLRDKSPKVVNQYLLEQGINTSVTLPFSSLMDLHDRGLMDGAVRASVHYYNTEQEVDQLVDVLSHLLNPDQKSTDRKK